MEFLLLNIEKEFHMHLKTKKSVTIILRHRLKIYLKKGEKVYEKACIVYVLIIAFELFEYNVQNAYNFKTLHGPFCII